ncbi:MAG TPA: NAD-dependent epimerase/dehydratase family protein [Nitrospiria bacterium]|jgi:dihydroflavonol-4-reductase
MKALVLGAPGHLGSNLVRVLLQKGYPVRAFKRSGKKTTSLDGLPIEFAEGDFLQQGTLLRAMEGCDVLFHAGGYYPLKTISAKDAVSHALREIDSILNSAREMDIQKVIFTSTLTQIGFPKEPKRLADETNPFETRFTNNPYLMAKQAMEEEIRNQVAGGLPVVMVNPTVFFGPYDSRPTSGTQILMIAKQQMPAYVDGPINVIDVRDVAIGEVLALEKGKIGERYILGNWNTTQRELNELIAKLANVPAPKLKVPGGLARLGVKIGEAALSLMGKDPPVPSFIVEALCHFQHYDCQKAVQDLGLPQSPVENAIRDALTWFKEHHYLSS